MRKIVSILALSLTITGCANDKKPEVEVKNSTKTTASAKKNTNAQRFNIQFFDTFDTVTSITVYDENQTAADEKLARLKEEFIRLHKIFDRYNNYEGINNLKTVNDKAGIEPVKVDKELYNLLEKTFNYNEEIGDKLNIALGPVVDLWTDYRDAYEQGLSPEDVKKKFGKEIPDEEMLNKYRELVNQDNIILNPEEKTVFLKEKGMKIDLGSVAKGYATELVAQYAIDEVGVESGMISAGGNVRLIGSPEDKDYFKVAIQHPDKEQSKEYAAVIKANDTFIVTSGDYERYFEYDGKRYCHIIDAQSLVPASKYRSVTIVTKDSMLADYLSTVLFLSDLETGKDICKKLSVEAIWYLPNNEIVTTDGAKEMMVSQ